MATTWGNVDDHLRVGIDLSVSGTTITAKYSVSTDGAGHNWADDQSLSLTGAISGSANYYNGLTGPWQAMTVTTRTLTGGRGATYTFYVRALGAYNGASPTHSRSITIPALAPSKVGKPDATAYQRSIAWSWDAPASNGASITKYQLQVSASSSFSSTVYSGTTTGRSKTVTGLSPGVRYWGRVRAYNSAGWGSYSSSRYITTTPDAPSAPGTPSVSTSGTSATLTWAAPSSDGGASITGYRLQVATNSSFTNLVHNETSTGRSQTVTGLAPTATYYARVYAGNGYGENVWSGTRTFTMSPVPPSAPGTPSVSTSGTSATLTWAAPSSDGGASITGYRVYVSTSSSFDSVIRNENPTGRSVVITGLTPTATYYARVYAGNGYGSSDWSGTRSWKQPMVPPGAPGSVTIAATTTNEVHVTFMAPSDRGGGTLTGYQLQVSTSSSMTGAVTFTGTSSPIVATGLDPSRTYYVRVRASNSAGWGDWSPIVSGTTLAAAFGKTTGTWVPVPTYGKRGGTWVPVPLWRKVGSSWQKM